MRTVTAILRAILPVAAVAKSDDPKVYVERFGDKYLTVFNDSDRKKDVVVTITTKPPAKAKELLSGAGLTVTDGKLKLTLGAEDVAVIELD